MKGLGRDRAWRDFVGWCRARRLRSLPAHPWTVAAYARWCETRHRYPAIVKRIKAIARVHLLRCRKPADRHPTVMRTLRMIEVRGRLRRLPGSLFRAEDFVGAVPRPPTGHARARSAPARRALRSTPPLVARRPSAR